MKRLIVPLFLLSCLVIVFGCGGGTEVILSYLYFSGTDGTNGYELWKSDGTETVMIRDIYEGDGNSSSPRRLTNVNGTLYFSANDGTNGGELWKSNGTEAGTAMVKDITGDATESYLDFLTNLNGIMFFAAGESIHGYEPWKSDGTKAGTVMIKDLFVGPDNGIFAEYE
jgi:ELWxxDGT repeat protein